MVIERGLDNSKNLASENEEGVTEKPQGVGTDETRSEEIWMCATEVNIGTVHYSWERSVSPIRFILIPDDLIT